MRTHSHCAVVVPIYTFYEKKFFPQLTISSDFARTIPIICPNRRVLAMESVADAFGCKVFNDKMMKRYLPKDTYEALKATIRVGRDLDINIANVVANAMKDWAVENGATHYTHWFQPLTGATAEKHNSFLSPLKDGSAIMEFSGKELVSGEPDASSFPSGGLRATFEARGYTAWDPTSFAFIKEGTLCIPTAFCSFTGETLDKKTPLLRSMERLNDQALRILRLFGNTSTRRVSPTTGLEQEYFLIDKALFMKRKDLRFCGRTILGAKPVKGQELDDHYFGAIKPRVLAFMQDLDEELWKFGIVAKTRHNEVAPSQHELACLFTTTNLSVDQNQLVMEEMRKIADRHGLACLLHEKPFDGINGSGKHNNWSMCTDTGANLLEPGDSPVENAQFLLFLTALIEAVDRYQDLIRISVASASNDHRLGADEAPPAIVSMFLGDELTDILESIAKGSIASSRGKDTMVLGVHVLPDFPRDATDRNRTSPIAFTGNKFELRMLGSSFNAAGPNIVLNTALACVLDSYATELEDVVSKGGSLDEGLTALVGRRYREHSRIVFNGNNYSMDWRLEAQRRGLLNLQTTVDAAEAFSNPTNIDLFQRYGIFTKSELESRREIVLESYNKTVNIEALTMLDMIRTQVIPAVSSYSGDYAQSVARRKALCPSIDTSKEESFVSHLSGLLSSLFAKADALDEGLHKAYSCVGSLEKGRVYSQDVLHLMNDLRATADEAESLVSGSYWPYPTYGELLFST